VWRIIKYLIENNNQLKVNLHKAKAIQTISFSAPTTVGYDRNGMKYHGTVEAASILRNTELVILQDAIPVSILFMFNIFSKSIK
jgi:hypothetical protein